MKNKKAQMSEIMKAIMAVVIVSLMFIIMVYIIKQNLLPH